MKYMGFKSFYTVFFIIFAFASGCFSGGGGSSSGQNIADHTVAKLTVLDSISDSSVNRTKSKLIIAYGHTSHGSQIVDGVSSLSAFMNNRGRTSDLFSGLDLRTDMGNYTSSYGAYDLNQPNYGDWVGATRSYLSSNPDVNVVIWSWCAGVSHADETIINEYIQSMSQLETDYPGVSFVYMTGHLDGTGLSGNLHVMNEKIRKYCRENNKLLFDFADIESYDPDGTCFIDKHATDGCNYDFDGSGTTTESGDPAEPTEGDRNWASDWQNAHTLDIDWYNCSAAHSKPVNANMKAYAFWWLMVRIAELQD